MRKTNNLPKAPCRRSLKSALTVVSFVHILSKTYSVKWSSGANVTGDLFSQCKISSDVLNIPKIVLKITIVNGHTEQEHRNVY